MMDDRLEMRVFEGERKLLPTDGWGGDLLLTCLSGEGYLRVMSSVRRIHLRQGEAAEIRKGEVVTLTGRDTMQVSLEKNA